MDPGGAEEPGGGKRGGFWSVSVGWLAWLAGENANEWNRRLAIIFTLLLYIQYYYYSITITTTTTATTTTNNPTLTPTS